MKLKMLVAAFVLVGCGGGSFTGVDALDPMETDGGADALSAGGRPSADSSAPVSTGGASSGGAPNATGGSPSSGGTVGSTGGTIVADACALVTHHNGVGQTWEDCTPLGTHGNVQAMKACQAWPAGDNNVNVCGGTQDASIIGGPATAPVGMHWTEAGEVRRCPLSGGGSCVTVGSWD